MQNKRKSNKVNDKEEIMIEENIKEATEKDNKIVAKGHSSTSLQDKNTQRCN